MDHICNLLYCTNGYFIISLSIEKAFLVLEFQVYETLILNYFWKNEKVRFQ
jgi:hypothetical protein